MPRSSERYSARSSERLSVADGNARGRGETGEVEVDRRQQTADISQPPKNGVCFGKRGHHIAAQVVTQGASLTRVHARAIHAGQSASPDFPQMARFSTTTVHPENRSNEREARA